MIREWPLIGRSEELQVITHATRAGADRARGIVLSGAAGVGKTRLAREAVAQCGRRNTLRHWIVGTESATSVPLGAFAVIASDFGPDPLRGVREVIDGLIGSHIGEVVVGVDDAHLLDDLSAFAIHQLVTRHLATVILTVRSGESPPDAITTLWKDHHLERIELQPLSLTETTRLVQHMLDGQVQSLSAQRLWQFTQGNALYLHHLMESEVSAGRMAQHAGVWLWDGQPTLSPTLAELIEARIGQVPRSVRDVLDALAVAEPLEADVLQAITDPEALAEAESLGLVRQASGGRAAMVRLTHPMFGEVRRAASLRLRQLRGLIATELGERRGADPRDLVRRAMLTIESDLAPDPELLVAAASAAMQLLDVRLAEALARQAVAAGGGPEAQIAHAAAITWLERGTEAETMLAGLAGQTSGQTRLQVAILRTFNFTGILGQTSSAEREIEEAIPVDDQAAQTIATALRAMIDVVRGHSSAAVDRARTVLANPPSNELVHMLSIHCLVSGLGDLGRIDDTESAANIGYNLADTSQEASHPRAALVFAVANAYRLAGAFTALDATTAHVRRDTFDVPFEQSWYTLLSGMSAMSRGSLAEAQRLLQEALAYTSDSGRLRRAIGRSWFTTVKAMAGRAADARQEFDAIERWTDDLDACWWDSVTTIAEAWTCAAEGAMSQAISLVRHAAEKESELGRSAWEVCLLQTATQFGDHTTAARLAELADTVQGPRAPAAAAHAAALAAGNGDALIDASRRYEEFGDRLAAADAAAQAVATYRDVGRRGTALSASTTARRLAAECQGADTPALRAATIPLPFTDRQHKIISLAAQGLSNKEIAEQLTISVRSIEGHLFRASQRAGTNSRDQLIAILRGT